MQNIFQISIVLKPLPALYYYIIYTQLFLNIRPTILKYDVYTSNCSITFKLSLTLRRRRSH